MPRTEERHQVKSRLAFGLAHPGDEIFSSFKRAAIARSPIPRSPYISKILRTVRTLSGALGTSLARSLLAVLRRSRGGRGRGKGPSKEKNLVSPFGMNPPLL